MSSLWVDCAQDVEGGDTLGIPSAFALALGLILNPAFRIDDAESTFQNEAQFIFEAALVDRLDWRLLYAFLFRDETSAQGRRSFCTRRIRHVSESLSQCASTASIKCSNRRCLIYHNIFVYFRHDK